MGIWATVCVCVLSKSEGLGEGCSNLQGERVLTTIGELERVRARARTPQLLHEERAIASKIE